MRPGISDKQLRESMRRNIGNPRHKVLLWPGITIPGRFGTTFDGTELTVSSPPPDSVSPGGSVPPISTPTLPQGRILGVTLSTPTATRDVGVTDPLPVPCVIRCITVMGDHTIGTGVSFRVLLAYDTDVSQVADPSGNDLIFYAGDIMTTEDAGVHAHLAAGPLVVEPWRKVTTSGARIKLKISNVTGSTRATALYVDVDELTAT